MTDQLRSTARFSIGGALTTLTAVAAHIPCCGSQLLAGIFGMQALGAISTSYLYKYQFFMPIFVSVILAGALKTWGWVHRTQHFSHESFESHRDTMPNWKNFIILNLVIGYVVIGLLYCLIPPHKHHIIDVHMTGRLTQDHQTILVAYHDDNRTWPWSERIFVAPAIAKAAPAQELFWYDIKPEKVSSQPTDIPVHLYARPTGTWLAGSDQATRPLQFYVSKENSDTDLLSMIDQFPAFVIFYSRDCLPCHAEMNMLPELKKAAGDLPISIASLTPPEHDFVEKLKTLDIKLIDVSDQDTKVLLRSLNDQRLALPFSMAFDGKRAVCAQRVGLLGLDIIKDWRKACL